MPLTDEQWLLLQPLFETGSASPPKRGRPPSNPRPILDAILLKLATRRPWRETRTHNPSWQTCYRSFQLWWESGILRRALLILHHDLLTRGEFDLQKAVRDGLISFPNQDGRPRISLSPSILFTWQGQTAVLYYQYSLEMSEWRHHPGTSPPPLVDILGTLGG